MAGETIAILNAIRNSASTEYATRVPLATQANIATVGNAILAYQPTVNEFTGILLDKIGKTIITSKLANNELKMFKRGEMPFGSTIEDIFVEMAQAEGAYDPTGSNPLGRRLSDVRVMYHSENRQDCYPKSITEAQLHKAFRSAEGVADLISGQINAIYSGATHDEFTIMKEMLAGYELKYYDYQITAITDEATARAFVKTVRKAVGDLKFMSTKFNNAGVTTRTDPTEQVLIVNKDVIAHVDVDVLSKAFNLGKTDFEPMIIVVDDFGSMTDTYGVLIDKDFLFSYDTLNQLKTQENAHGLFTNYFLHIHQLISTCEFMNAIRFTTALGTGTDILTFVLEEQTEPSTVDATSHTVAIEVEALTDVTELAPVITLSPEATIAPLSGAEVDFTDPVEYTVTAEDGTTQDWTVTVTVAE